MGRKSAISPVDVVKFSRKLRGECEKHKIPTFFRSDTGLIFSLSKIHTVPKVFLHHGKFCLDINRHNITDEIINRVHMTRTSFLYDASINVSEINNITDIEAWLLTRIMDAVFLPNPPPEW